MPSRCLVIDPWSLAGATMPRPLHAFDTAGYRTIRVASIWRVALGSFGLDACLFQLAGDAQRPVPRQLSWRWPRHHDLWLMAVFIPTSPLAFGSIALIAQTPGFYEF